VTTKTGQGRCRRPRSGKTFDRTAVVRAMKAAKTLGNLAARGA
jgi:hypothetical protein